MYEEFFRADLHLPFHPFIVNILDFYLVVPTQLAPNSIRIIVSFVSLCHMLETQPRVSLFQAFFFEEAPDGEGLVVHWPLLGSHFHH